MKYFNNDIFSNPGDPIHIIFSPVFDEKGNIELVESGKENTDDIIQSFAEECDLNVILSKYLNGDNTVLSNGIGSYGDFTNMPKTYAEVLQLQIDAKKLFNELPVDFKQKFDNDPNKFFVQAGSEEGFEKLDPLFNANKEIIKENVEVKEE